MVDTPRSERDALCMGVRVSPGPPVMLPWRNRQTRLAQNECQHAGSIPAGSTNAPDRTVTVAASKTAIRGSIPRGCAMWEMPKRSRRLFAKQFLPGSSPGSHSIGGREATATLSGPENQRSGKDPDVGSTPPPSAITLKYLLFSVTSLIM